MAYVVAACIVKAFPQAAPYVAIGATIAFVLGIILVFAWIALCNPTACAVGNLFRRVFTLSALIGSWIVWLCPEIGIPIIGGLLLAAFLIEFFLARLDCPIEPVFEL
ncbi:MAG: hypothetical protein GY930_15895 [bacterium]|nr:hypothetical protein [bacterium]